MTKPTAPDLPPELAALAEWLDTALLAPSPVPDVLEREPGLGPDDAYRVQFAVMARRVARGDRIVGYKAALTSAAMQAQVGIPEPMLGTLLASRVFPEGPVSLSANGFLRPTLEPEIAVLLARDLRGPGVGPVDALGAAAGFLPAIELGDYRTGATSVRTLQGGVVCNTFNGGIVLGRPLSPVSGIDLRVEGMTLTRNGQPAGSGTGVEVLGDPLVSVAFMANKLGELGRTLEAGMVLMTGSIVRSIELAAGDHVQAAFSRLGSVEVRIAP